MFLSYRSSRRSNLQARGSVFKVFDFKQKKNNPYEIKNHNFQLVFSNQKYGEYKTNIQYQEFQIQKNKLQQTKKKADELIKTFRVAYNCQLTQSKNIEHEDSAKLMSFITGGYVDKDFDQYLSFKQFNQKKQDFQVLNDICEITKNKMIGLKKGIKNIKIEENNVNQFQKRSIQTLVYLKENQKKISRMKFQQYMKQHKLVN